MKNLLLATCLLLAACTDSPTAGVASPPLVRPSVQPAERNADSQVVTESETARADYRAQMILAAKLAEAAAPLPYLVVSAHDAGEFSEQVSARLREGYELRGPMRTERTATGNHGTFYYIQNLVLPGMPGSQVRSDAERKVVAERSENAKK